MTIDALVRFLCRRCNIINYVKQVKGRGKGRLITSSIKLILDDVTELIY